MNRYCVSPRDSEVLSQQAREIGWDIHYDQLASGRFAGAVEHAGTEEAQFFRERSSPRMCIHGAVPAGMATFLLPGRRTEGVTFCGGGITPATICALTPGDAAALCTPAGTDGFPFGRKEFT